MNDARRKTIRKLIKMVGNPNPDWDYVQTELSALIDDETDAMENIPENMQDTQRYVICEESIDHLESALAAADVDEDDPDSVLEAIEEIIEELSQIDGI